MRFVSALIAAVIGAVVALPAAAQSGDRFTIRDDVPSLRPIVVSYGLPLNRTYEELTPHQRALVRSQYEGLGPDDDPPFPANGLAPLYRAIGTAFRTVRVDGDLTLFVDIDATGEPVRVTVQKSPDPKLSRAAAALVMTQKFKPGSCNGTPCAMQYPFRFTTRD